MESLKQQRINKSPLNLSTKFLFSISFFSIALPIFLHYSKSQFNFLTCTIQLLSYNNDKNCMFLLFNGILVLIFKNAGLMGAERIREDRSESQEREAFVAEGKEHQMEEKPLEAMAEEAEFKEQKNDIVAVIDDDEDEEDGFGLLTAEELNKKCDEFIRKMKEGIKLEVQPLFMV